MFHLTDKRSLKPQLGFSCVAVFYQCVGLLLLTHCSEGQYHVIGPTQPVAATAGDDIILPCHLVPASEAVSMAVEWTRPDLYPRFVHLRRGGQDLLEDQNWIYEGRTSMSINRLKLGDFSLKLSKVKLSDEGKYRCYAPGLNSDAFVQLIVGAVSSPVIVGIDRVGTGLVLQCRSKGWYPEPEVSWLDSEGHVLSAGPSETVRGPDGLYTVSSRVTVEKRHNNNFTCRVQQKNINQTRETQIRISEDVFVARDRGSDVRISVVLTVVCLLLSAAAFFVFWKLRQKKRQNKMNQDEETEDRTGETEQLVQGSTTVKDLDDEKLKEKKEEKKDLMHVISVLMEQKKELENDRDELISKVEEVNKEKEKNEKKLKSVNKDYVWNKGDRKSQLLEFKDGLENEKSNYEKSLQKTLEKQQKTDDMITRITERKKKVEEQIEQIKNHLEETKRQKDEIQLQSEREETNKNTESSTFIEGHYTLMRINRRLS